MKIPILAILSLLSIAASAQTPIPTGDHEALTGNTGIARMGSPAAALYNPAGLATIERTQVSASGTLFQNSTQDVSGSINAHADNFQSIPTQLSTTGVHAGWHYAFSVFTIRSWDYTTPLNTQLPGGLGVAPTHLKATANSLLLGPSVGDPYGKDFYIGLSLFLQKDDDYQNTVARIDSTGATGTLHMLVQAEDRRSTYELLPVLGAVWQYDSNTTYGARLQLPSVPVSGHRVLTNQSVGYFVDLANTVTDKSQPESTVKENSKTLTPMEVSFGMSKILPRDLRVFGDLGYSLDMKWKPSATADEQKDSGSLKLSGGVEYGPAVNTWAAGAFYRQNNLRDQGGEVKSFMGLTVGYIKTTEHFDSGIGGTYMFGSGSSEGITNKLSSLGLLVSSTYKF